MKDDKTLLELAAKAAGYELALPANVEMRFDEASNDFVPWSPLTDDGDALRLAVKLGIQIGDYHQYGRALAFMGATRGSGEFWEVDGTPEEATCRAIVRAAAAIGERIQLDPNTATKVMPIPDWSE